MPWLVRRSPDRDAFYTRRPVVDACLDAVERRAALRMRAHETYVDAACGDNYVGARLRTLVGARTRAPVRIVAYDVAPPPPDACARDTIETRDFRSLERAPDGVRGACVVGFNLPFGAQGALLRALVAHACALFEPRALYLVHPRRLYAPAGYALAYQRRLARFSYYVPTTRRSFGAYGCFFSVFVRVRGARGSTGVRDAPPPAEEARLVRSLTLRATVRAADTLAVLRAGSRAGAVVVVLACAAPPRVYIGGERARDDRVPGAAPTACAVATTMYYKLELCDALDVDVDDVARRLSRVAALDPALGDASPPTLTRAHLVRALEYAVRRVPELLADVRAYTAPCAPPDALLEPVDDDDDDELPPARVFGDEIPPALVLRDDDDEDDDERPPSRVWLCTN